MSVILLSLMALPAVLGAKDVCITGYVMDRFCIDRGTLLDMPQLESLTNPDSHTLHCLLDPQVCWASGYEVLADPIDGSRLHCRAYRFDSAANDKFLAYARAAGDAATCTTCTNTTRGAPEVGFRVTVKGTIVDADASPPVISVSELLPEEAGCPNGDVIPENLNCAAGGDKPYIIAHGVMMFLAWAVMLPSGVISARFLKHVGGAPPIWFQIHHIVQPIGLLVATVGVAIGIHRFKVLDNAEPSVQLAHAVLGLTTMSLGWMQPINAILRPHPEPRTSRRVAWEICHKSTGYLAVLLGLITVGIGCKLASDVKLPEFGVAYIFAIIGLGLYASVAGYRQLQANKIQKEDEQITIS